MFKWYSDNNKKWPKEARMCIRCVTVCVSCDENFSLANAIKYGICLRCYYLAEDLKREKQYQEDLESDRRESERLEIEYAARKRKREEEQIEAKVGFRGYPEGFT